ncbi:unnamed protein product [Blepharisma stoltei]|uniref:Guanylate cyclase domain-containing protein n=1 Tax=Blepharisma stoltei TaxID=1481888 RepID=A0AAU9JD12_9CILI|nr:unnamed protein product [Blepharisma stoltei]
MSLSSNLDPDKKKNENWRYIHLLGNSKNPNKGYQKNQITTYRYTFLNFFPKNIRDQFRNYAYYWYLIDPISQLIENPNSYDWTSILPIALLLIFTFMFDAYRDIRNHKNDKKVNEKIFEIWDGLQFRQTKSENICVGDIILLNENDYAPADILIICIGENEKECYVEKSGFIGGTDIKVKKPIKDVQRLFDTIDIDEASTILGRINGKIKIPDSSSKDIKGTFKMSINPDHTEISSENFIQQWSYIIETSWILGVVIYTGNETSVSVSLREKYRISTIEKQLNIWVLWIGSIYFCFVIASFLVNLLIYGTKYDDNSRSLFLTTTFVLNRHVHIFLYVILPIIRFIQIWRLSKTYPGVTFHSSKALDELGQVEYILTDRSGTITKNKLMISSCMVNDAVYINTKTQLPDQKTDTSPFHTGNFLIDSANRRISNENLSFYTLKNELIGSQNRRGDVYNFIMCMAICNQFFPKISRKCISISADDRTLVETAGQLGIQLVSRTHKECLVNILGNIKVLDIIAYRPFSAKNKKNRIIVFDESTKETILYVKGTKESMNELFDLSNEDKLNIEENLYTFNLLGKRLIFMGYKVLTEKEIKYFSFAYKNAKRSPVNSEGRIESIFESLEQKLKFLGCITIEDKISKKTKNAVSLLTQAGIKFWLMSGDDEEITLTTAISANMFDLNASIARLASYSSHLECHMDMIEHVKRFILHVGEDMTDINPLSIPKEFGKAPLHSSQKLLSVPNLSEIDQNWTPKLSGIIEKKNIGREKSAVNNIHPFLAQLTTINLSSPLKMTFNPESVFFVLSVDARSITHELGSEENRKLFCALLSAANCVCFHSLLPGHKRQIASLLKNNFSYKPTFLTIGDGAGDVGMIKKGHVGIGIEGKKWGFAADAGDIAVKDFSQIKDLILFEGHWNYVKISNVILIYLFSSFMHTYIIFFYTFVKVAGGNAIFSIGMTWYYYGFLTAIPLIIIGIFDEDVEGHQIAKFPEIHNVGLHKLILTSKKLILISIKALIQSLLIFYMVLYCGILNNDGYTENGAYMSLVMHISLYGSFLAYLILETYSYSFISIIGYIISIISLIVYLEIMSEVPSSHMFGNLEMTNTSPLLFCQFFFIPLICLIVNYATKCYEIMFYPGFIDFIRSKFNGKLFFEAKSRVDLFNGRLDKVYKESKKLRNTKIKKEFTINKWILRFWDESTEKDYQNEKIEETLIIYRAFIMYRFIVILSIFIYVWSDEIDDTTLGPFFTVTAFIYAGFVAFSFISHFKYQRKTITLLMNLCDIIMIIIHSFVLGFQIPTIYLSWPSVIFIGSCTDWTTTIFSSLSASVFICISAYIHTSNLDGLTSTEAFISGTEFTIIYSAIWISSAIIGYSVERYNREKFILLKKVENEVEKSKQVLDCVLPDFVRKRVKDGARYIADDQGTATVLFCDIHNFEDIVDAYPLYELTAFLDNVYRQFDNLCEIIGVTKVETVGKTYMACAGIKDSEAELDWIIQSVPHARRAVEMGLAMIKAAEKIKLKSGGSLQVKVGIHSGPVTAGVVGFHKPQFSLVGDTVNTASRMSSTNQDPNTIQISEETYNSIEEKDDFAFAKRQVEAKGKGFITAYTVRESELNDLPLFSFGDPDFVMTNSMHSVRKRTMVEHAWSPERRPSVATGKEPRRRHATVTGVRRKSIALSPDAKKMPTLTPADGKRNSIVIPSAGRQSTLNSVEKRNSLFTSEARKQSIMTTLGVYDQSLLYKRRNTDKIDPIKFHPFSCRESNKERCLRIHIIEHSRWMLKIRILTAFICSLLLGIMKFILIQLSDNSNYNIISAIYFTSVLIWYISLWRIFARIYKSKYISWIMQVGYLTPIILVLIMRLNRKDEVEIVEVSYLLYCTLLSSQCICSFFKNIISTTILATIFIALDQMLIGGSANKYIYLISIISFEFAMLSISYFTEKTMRFNYALEDFAKKELEKTESLLKQMMPPHVYNNLKEETTTTDSLSQVTLLYADIVGFTEWSSQRTPDNIVGMLYELFSKFDMKCVEHKVYKVHTIGDCYVAMGFNGDIERNPGEECLKVIRFAESMVEIIEKVNAINNSKLNMRIGIHTGNIIGGIAGTNIVRYDIYGKDVLIANKIESNGAGGKILVSEAVKSLIEGYKPELYNFTFHKEIPIQAIKSKINAFWLDLD